MGWNDRAGRMWNDAALLGSLGASALWVSAIAAMVATAAGLFGGIAANRSNDLTTRASNERIAAANARAEEAKLETVRLWSQVSWRRVTPDQAARLATALAGQSFEVWTTYVGKDPESNIYRDEIDAALRAAGLTTKGFSGWTVALGLKVAGPDSDEKEALVGALRAAGFRLEVEGPSSFMKDELVMIIGTKPEPVRPALTADR